MSLSLITQYFPDLTPQQSEQFAQLEALYREWNEQINVISRKDIDQLYERHVLHSLGIAKVLRFKSGSEILDVGTGGGFPGIPLAILFPDSQFHLVDSIGKKIKVVQEVSRAIGLKNVTAEHQRAEKVKRKFDFVISRAVTNLPKFMNFINGKIKARQKNALPNGLLYLKGGEFDEELKSIRFDAEVYPLSEHFSEAFFESKKVVYVRMV
ncbi:MAG: 16S rRNA (guanine(527)-N(7))-methyltransferase RsmG [Flavobacteriales bacterium]|nr:16S rRNA (guanine(527)-N(7))-methyltransferase RsmG [Flavobacteriales bacterium]